MNDITPEQNAKRETPRCDAKFAQIEKLPSYRHDTKLRDFARTLETELQQLRLAADGMAKHGAEFMRLHLLQGIAQAEYKEARFMNSADEHELAHRVSELSCLLSDAQSAFEKSEAAYRAAGEDRS